MQNTRVRRGSSTKPRGTRTEIEERIESGHAFCQVIDMPPQRDSAVTLTNTIDECRVRWNGKFNVGQLASPW